MQQCGDGVLSEHVIADLRLHEWKLFRDPLLRQIKRQVSAKCITTTPPAHSHIDTRIFVTEQDLEVTVKQRDATTLL